ncbi:MAG: hypothetical protein J0I14_09130 [Propionibacteriaceae bacterium]|nr:hypothetical protein [Propionibacteriaceae bacterium]
MRHRRLALVTAAALAVAPFAAEPAQGHAAAPRPAAAPADAVAPALVRRVFTDVDGDGTRDRVDLDHVGANSFELVVTTTKGATAKAQFSSHVDDEDSEVPATQAWYGASAIDAHKGSELIVRLLADPADLPDETPLGVYTWRSGALVAGPAPATPRGRLWTLADQTGWTLGYRFFSSHHRRYVDATYLVTDSTGPGYHGRITRSVWRKGAWVTLSTRKAKPTDDPAWSQTGIAGPRLLLGQVRADVNGDRRTDLVSSYQIGANSYLLRVTLAGGRVVEKKHSASVEYPPLMGAAGMDGVAGAEVAVHLNDDDQDLRVYTWRHGTLTYLRSPASPGGSANSKVWYGGGDGFLENYAFSSVAGVRYVVASEISDVDGPEYGISYVRSVWRGGTWVKLKAWSVERPTQEEQDAFSFGFTAPDLARP